MASNYPSSIDSFVDPLSNSPLNSPNHAQLHQDVNDAVEKIETKLGTGASPASSATSGQVLTANGSGSSWQTPAVTAAQFATVGLVLVKSQTFALTNNLIIDDIFSSSFIDYRVILEVENISAAVAIQMQLRNGTTNLGTSGYYAAGTLAVTGASSISFIGENNSAQFLACVPYTTGNYAFCDMDIYRPNQVQYTMIASKNMNFRDSPSLMESRFMNGSYQQTTATTGMRFFTTGATFAGRYVVYGYKSA